MAQPDIDDPNHVRAVLGRTHHGRLQYAECSAAAYEFMMRSSPDFVRMVQALQRESPVEDFFRTG
jgi:hypothetical protein